MIAQRSDFSVDLTRGLEHCRNGEWEKGLTYLGRVANAGDRAGNLPGLFYSYLGYAIARCQQRVDEGVRLCQHAIKIEFYQPENYLNLARTMLLVKNRRSAVRVLNDGLKVDLENTQLLTLKRELGERRPPVLPFLSRSNPLNIFLGSLRHKLKG